MSPMIVVGAVLTLGLFFYLGVALLYPEKLS